MVTLSRRTRIILSLGSSFALVAAIGASASDAPLTCLYAEKNVCKVVAPHIAITVGFDPSRGESLLTYLTPSPVGYVESKSESISPSLEADVLDGNLDFEDARLIEAEMLARPKATYFVPSDVQLLLDDVGFPSSKALTPNEYVELLQVHMQLALDISPLTAAFLVERLGVEALTSKRVIEHAAEPVAKPPTMKPATQPVTEPSAANPTTTPVTEPATAPVTEKVSEPVAEQIGKEASTSPTPHDNNPVILPSFPSVIETDAHTIAL